MRFSRMCFAALGQGRIRFAWFYPEWAEPTSRIASVLILAAGLVISFPYVPGSGSKVFQGAGLFVGVLAALGSSSVATNIISGLMLIYTRAFTEGDRVTIDGVVGVVQERALLVTRLLKSARAAKLGDDLMGGNDQVRDMIDEQRGRTIANAAPLGLASLIAKGAGK